MPEEKKRPIWSTFNAEEWKVHCAAANTSLHKPIGTQFIVLVKLKRGANFDGVQYLQDQVRLIAIVGLGITKMETWNGKIRLNFQIDSGRDEEDLKTQFKEVLMGLRIKEDPNIIADVIFV